MLELKELVTTNGIYENIFISNCKDIHDLVYKINKDIIIEFSDNKTLYKNYVMPQYIVSFKI